jgi:secreted PhoX family phosphatase
MKDEDIVSNRSNNPSFEEIIEARLSRRGFLGGSLAATATIALGGVSALLKAVPAAAQKNGEPLSVSKAYRYRPPTVSWCPMATLQKS